MSQPPRPTNTRTSQHVENPKPQSGSLNAGQGEDDPVANLASSRPEAVTLPSFVVQNQQALMVDLGLLAKHPSAFVEFVTYTFSIGAYFLGLDYRVFQTILYDPETTAKVRSNLVAAGKGPLLRFADSVARFPEERRGLYRAVKTSARFADASYFLEPVILEKTVSSIAEDGSLVNRTVSEPARLNFDEFIAHLWNYGIRFGVLEAEVRARLAEDLPKVGWVVIAKQLDPKPGKDAEIREEFDKLHRDRSPAARADGTVDLRQFKNTFPQVGKNVRLVRKVPRVFGIPGRNVGGFPIEPPPPNDVDLDKLAGGWVRTETEGGIEFLVTSMAGFLNVDPKTSQFFITEGLINREGISVRTTGSLNIEAEEFEEHGDVEKGFSVTGNSIRVRGNVFGSVNSKSGVVRIGGNVSNGDIRNTDGPVEIAGFASNAYIDARNGEVRLKRAENSVVLARTAILGEIRNCMVVADRIEIKKLQNCVIAGNAVTVDTAGVKQGFSERDENIFVLEVPDLSELERDIAEKARIIAEVQAVLVERKSEISKKRGRYDQIMATPPVRAYLENARKAKQYRDSGKTPNPDQAKVLAQQRNLLAAELSEIAELSSVLKALAGTLGAMEQTLEAEQKAKAKDEAKLAELSTNVSIVIHSVTGATVVRKRKIASQTLRVHDFQNVADLRKELDTLGDLADRVFQGDSGSVDWKFE